MYALLKNSGQDLKGKEVRKLDLLKAIDFPEYRNIDQANQAISRSSYVLYSVKKENDGFSALINNGGHTNDNVKYLER